MNNPMGFFAALSSFIPLVYLGTTESVSVSNTCRGLKDGVYTLKLLDGPTDVYPLVSVKCSNQYMIIDAEADPNLLKYFSSYELWHYAIIGPSNEDHVNWREWYLPSAPDTDTADSSDSSDSDVSSDSTSSDDSDSDSETTFEFLYSADCSSCYERDLYGHFGGSDDVPYMSGNLFGCFWPVRGSHDSDMDWNTYECYYQHCVETKTLNFTTTVCNYLPASTTTQRQLATYAHVMPGACATLPKSATYAVATSHDVKLLAITFSAFFFVFVFCFSHLFCVFPGFFAISSHQSKCLVFVIVVIFSAVFFFLFFGFDRNVLVLMEKIITNHHLEQMVEIVYVYDQVKKTVQHLKLMKQNIIIIKQNQQEIHGMKTRRVGMTFFIYIKKILLMEHLEFNQVVFILLWKILYLILMVVMEMKKVHGYQIVLNQQNIKVHVDIEMHIFWDFLQELQ